MKLHAQLLVLATLALSGAAFGQTFNSAEQVHYFANLVVGDGIINITQDGSTASVASKSDSICVNVYAFDPAEELVACCACSLTPNALQSLSVKTDLISNVLTPATPTSVTVTLIATDNPVVSGTTGSGTISSCNAANTLTASGAGSLATSMIAWGTTIHPNPQGSYDNVETQFANATFNATEAARIEGLCGFIQTDASGYGICKSCIPGGLGAAHE